MIVFLPPLAVGEAPTDAPILPLRPSRALSGVVFAEARCRPADVIANRLDPWHGAHFHPHSFARLSVLEARLWLSPDEQVELARLKKHKLRLKDEISMLVDLVIPDIIA